MKTPDGGKMFRTPRLRLHADKVTDFFLLPPIMQNRKAPCHLCDTAPLELFNVLRYYAGQHQ